MASTLDMFIVIGLLKTEFSKFEPASQQIENQSKNEKLKKQLEEC